LKRCALETTPFRFRQHPSPDFADWLLKFITEDGSGKRAKRNSAEMHAIRSQARKHGLLERQRRHAATQGAIRDRHQSLRSSSAEFRTQPYLHLQDVRSCTCVECAYAYSQEIERQFSHEGAYWLTGSEDGLTEYESGMLARSGTGQQPHRLRDIQRQIMHQFSPQTMLGAGRVDPFQCYPIKAEPYVHNLVDHCKRWLFITIKS